MDEISIEFVPKTAQGSDYDWVNLVNKQGERVGKARCLIERDQFTIFSVNVYPEFERRGYAGSFVNYAKNKYKTLIANRVRFKAIGFWEKMGFVPADGSDYIFQSRKK